MQRLILTSALGAILPLLAAAPATAQEVTASRYSAIETLMLSRTVFDEGLVRSDPYLLIAAASLRRSVPLDAELAAEGDWPEAQIIGWSAMLDAAEAFATHDPAILGVIADLRAQTSRGVSTGALFRNATLAPGSATEFEAVAFDGAEAAEVYVEGVEAADLNLFVYDETKELICADEDTSYIAHCYWEPEVPSTYVIKVVNGGAITSSYALITN